MLAASLNTKVKAVNEQMIPICAENDMLFIPHTSLQTMCTSVARAALPSS